jgi:hypothetical protein
MELKKDDITISPAEKVRKSRGAIQREKKRQRQQEAGDDDKHDGVVVTDVDRTTSKVDIVKTSLEASSTKKKARCIAPPKKQAKLDAEEVTFSNLVASYQRQATAAITTKDNGGSTDNPSKPKRRWYE